jgi:hypothetical protein
MNKTSRTKEVPINKGAKAKAKTKVIKKITRPKGKGKHLSTT